MPTYEVELDNGDRYHVDAENEPSHEEVLSALGYKKPQQPASESSATGAFARGVGANVGKTAGTVAGAIYGAEGGAALGSMAGPIGTATGAVIGGIGGALGLGYAGDKAQEALQGDQFTNELKAQREIDAQQHGIASNMGDLAAGIPTMFVAPELQAGKLITPLTKLGAKTAEAVAPMTRAAQMGQHVVNTALGGSIMSAGETGGQLQRGEITPEQVPGAIVKGTATMAPLGFIPGAGTAAGEIAGNAYKYLGKPLLESATAGVSSAAYNAATGEEGPGVIQGTMQNAPGFIALNALASLAHGRLKPLESVKPGDSVQNENLPTQTEQPAAEAPKPGSENSQMPPVDSESNPTGTVGRNASGTPTATDLQPESTGRVGAVDDTVPPRTFDTATTNGERDVTQDDGRGVLPPEGNTEHASRADEYSGRNSTKNDATDNVASIRGGDGSRRGGIENQASVESGLDSIPINNRSVNARRIAAGLEPLEPGKGRSAEEMDRDAQRVLASDPQAGQKILARLESDPSNTPQDFETKVLNRHFAALNRSFEAAAKEVNDAYASGDKARHEAAVAEHKRLLGQLDHDTQIYRKAGTQQSSDFFARQGMDSLGADENGVLPLGQALVNAQAKRGGKPLTKEETASLTKAHNDYFKAKEQEAKAKEAEADNAAREAHSEAFQQDVKAVQAESILSTLSKAAEGATKRQQSRRGRLYADPFGIMLAADLADSTIIGAYHIANGATKFIDWSKAMIADFGPRIQEHLQALWKSSQQHLEETQKAIEHKTSESIVANAAQTGKVDAATIKELYKAHIRENLGKPSLSEPEILKRVHADVAKIDPSMTPRQVRDAYSEYGKIKKPSKDALKQEQARVRRLSQLASSMEDVLSGKPPKKSGWTPGQKSDEIRRVEQELKDTMREMGIKTTREDQLTDARKAVETRLKNHWQDLVDALHGKVKPRADRKPIEWTPEMREMQTQIQELHQYLADLTGPDAETVWNKQQQRAAEASRKYYELKAKTRDFGRSKPGFEANELTKRMKAEAAQAREEYRQLRESSGVTAKEANDRQIAQLTKRQAELKQELQQGPEFGPNRKPRELSPEAKALKAENDRINELLKWLRPKDPKARDPLTPEERAANAEKAAERTLANLEKEIAGEARARPDNIIPNAKLRALRAEAESLRGIRDAMRDAKIPRRTPDQIANEQLRKRLARSTYDIEQKLRTGDFSKKTKRQIELEDDTRKAQAENYDAKVRLQKEVRKIELSNRSDVEKAAAAIQGWHTASVLSGVMGWIKLPAAAAARFVTTPLDEAAGSAIRKIVPKLASQAPRHGGGIDLKIEAKAASEGLMTAIKGWRRTLTTGHTRADQYSGKVDLSELEHFAGRGFADLVGHIHALFKSPAKEAEFTRGVEYRTRHAIANDLDPNDWKVQLSIYNGAYLDANDTILKGQNFASNALNRLTASLKSDKKFPASSKAMAWLIDMVAPIKTVPVNFVLEAYRRSPVGLAHSVAEARNAYKTMIDGKIPEAQADVIMKHLKQGSVGSAAWLLAYLVPQIAGGYYQQGEKRKHDDLHPGDIGAQHTHILMHNSIAEAMTMGATTRKIADHMLKGHPEGFISGLGESFLGLAKQTPFVRTPQDLLAIGYGRGNERTKALGNFAQGMLIPRGLTEIAQITDPVERRKTKELPDYLKAGIPGLRQTLPPLPSR